jgi:hypothetical protein
VSICARKQMTNFDAVLDSGFMLFRPRVISDPFSLNLAVPCKQTYIQTARRRLPQRRASSRAAARLVAQERENSRNDRSSRQLNHSSFRHAASSDASKDLAPRATGHQMPTSTH